MVLVHNLAASPAEVTLDVTSSRHSADDLDGKALLDLFGGAGPLVSRKGTVNLDLEPYGYRWLRIPDPDDHRLP